MMRRAKWRFGHQRIFKQADDGMNAGDFQNVIVAKFRQNVEKTLASIVLPVPGGPESAMLCPPAAAISNPLLALSCPLISEKSMS